MAEEKKGGGGGDVWKELWLFLFVMAGLWILWFMTGGPESERAKRGTFLRPPAPLDTGETYGDLPILSSQGEAGSSKTRDPFFKRQPGLEDARENKTSFFKDQIIIRSARGASASSPSREYIEIYAPSTNKNQVYITGWTFKNSKGESLSIGKAARLPLQSDVSIESNLFLPPGEKAYIITGRSPLGISFKMNMCSGFFEQFQDFSPSLSNECPLPSDFIRPTDGLEPQCQVYIRDLDRCEVPLDPAPTSLSLTCREFIATKINYNECVSRFQNSPGFFSPEWRIYMGRSSSFWDDDAGLIRLYDNAGNLVDAASY